ncbi:N-acetyllactosaminide beta-1,3-N-acetylglucosaminyltransferase 3 isoform X2 [Equus asinus]|uniref:N-acetyllactosaminide beta-1,3-N-acetylglucosaminyltransferase 3 isoform X2 n=1 Tax=Equus asinus TaxID=9793 RepID=UPI0038F6507D
MEPLVGYFLVTSEAGQRLTTEAHPGRGLPTPGPWLPKLLRRVPTCGGCRCGDQGDPRPAQSPRGGLRSRPGSPVRPSPATRMRLRTEVALAAGLGAFGLLVLWSLRAPSPPCRSPQPTPGPPAPPAPRAPGAPRAPCRANASAAAQPDFAGQPQQVRDFLLYRHCRDFALLQDAPAKCAEPVFLLLAIKSSPANYERRELLRRTWARERRVRGAPLRRLFLLGTAADPREARKVDRLLALEARAHGDILQWDFHDSFFNLTLKQVLFLQWQQTRCANASFMLNGDDDVFAHTDNMVSYLQDHSPDRHLFVGQLIRNVGPIRVPWSKYYVPKIVTPDDHYPPYCGGGGFLLSRFTAAALHRASQGLELFPIDDVFLGMCLRREGLEPASHSGIRTSGVGAPSASMSSFDPCFYRELLLVHRFLPYEMLLMWEALSQPNLTCGKQTQVF